MVGGQSIPVPEGLVATRDRKSPQVADCMILPAPSVAGGSGRRKRSPRPRQFLRPQAVVCTGALGPGKRSGHGIDAGRQTTNVHEQQITGWLLKGGAT